MGGSTPKQFLTLGGLPVLVHCLRVLELSESVEAVVLAVPEADREFCLHDIVSRHGFAKVAHIVAGGAQRQDSVRLGLTTVKDDTDLVLVHDAVRPFFTPDLVNRVVAKAVEHGAAIVAIPMRDTVKSVDAGNLVETTVDRRRLWLAQTPQVFRRALLEEAHRKAQVDDFYATDDAQLVERLGHRVAIVEGSGENIKITRPEDLAIGEAILAARSRRDT
jgi:2-C-methyl-D-erythritol 4-phosphate cytidylyltransferase